MTEYEYKNLNPIQFKVYCYFVANTDLRQEDLRVRDLNAVASRIDWKKCARERRKKLISLVKR